MAKREVKDEREELREESQWKGFKTWALEQYRNADSVQICLTVDYLKARAAKSVVRSDEGEVEYYINEFDDVEAEPVKLRGLRWYDRMVIFLEGLPVSMARKIYDGVKLDTNKVDTFKQSGAFNRAMSATINHNRADGDFD